MTSELQPERLQRLYPDMMIVSASLYALFPVMGAVVTALADHGVYFANAGAPNLWPKFCLAYEVTAAAYLTCLLRSGRIRTAARAQ
jgi:hypothetical protein